MKTVKLSKKFQITIPGPIRDKMSLVPLPGNYSEYTRNLYSKIWKKVDVGKYIKNERKSWDKKRN